MIVAVQMQAPQEMGAYDSYWRLKTPTGLLFGSVVFLRIKVDASASDAEPATPTARPSPTTAPTPKATLIPERTPTTAPKPTHTTSPSPAATATTPATPVPTITPTSTSTPSPTPTPQAVSSTMCEAPDQRFDQVLNQALPLNIDVLCATGPVTERAGKAQLFWADVDIADPHRHHRSFVIAQSNAGIVYVLEGKDVNTYLADVQLFEDLWQPGMPDRPEACAPLVAPQGYSLPSRRIGKVWCERSLWNTIGWPMGPSEDLSLIVQETSNGLLIELRGTQVGGDIDAYSIAIDLHTGLATVVQMP